GARPRDGVDRAHARGDQRLQLLRHVVHAVADVVDPGPRAATWRPMGPSGDVLSRSSIRTPPPSYAATRTFSVGTSSSKRSFRPSTPPYRRLAASRLSTAIPMWSTRGGTPGRIASAA